MREMNSFAINIVTAGQAVEIDVEYSTAIVTITENESKQFFALFVFVLMPVSTSVAPRVVFSQPTYTITEGGNVPVCVTPIGQANRELSLSITNNK